MNMLKITSLALLASGLFLSAVSTATAASSCDQYTTSYDRTFCFCKLIVESDKELNDLSEAGSDLEKQKASEEKSKAKLKSQEDLLNEINSYEDNEKKLKAANTALKSVNDNKAKLKKQSEENTAEINDAKKKLSELNGTGEEKEECSGK